MSKENLVPYDKTCPHCGAAEVPKEEQPVSGTHAFTIKYSCGSRFAYLLSSNDRFEEIACEDGK